MSPWTALSSRQLAALREFARLGISVDQFLSELEGVIRAVSLLPSNREVHVDAVPPDLVNVSLRDIRWVLQRYLHGGLSGLELSNWAGLLLAVHSYSFPAGPEEDEVLQLLTDLAMPLREEGLDREYIKNRLLSLEGR